VNPAIKKLVARWSEFEDLTRATAVLEWDQEVNLPEGGSPARGNHLATLAGVAHEKIVSPAFKTALHEANKTRRLSLKEQAMVREAKREHQRASKIPAALVQEVARAESRGLDAWKNARRTNRWREFANQLHELVRLKRRVADAVGYRHLPYDALLDVFEPDATVKELDPLLGEVREATIPLVRKVRASKRRPNRRILTRKYPADGQMAFGRMVVEAMGFDFARGRIDLSTHPFCSGFDRGDVRLTTRIHENDLRSCLFGVIHEAGHGLYEQGLDPKLVRTPIGHAVSLGIHESQSRMWENVVGRSQPFWRHFLPKLRRVFPTQLKGVKLADFHFAINEVTPSFIRVEADEVTYNLHVILRYEIEKGLLDGTIKTKDLPAVWNGKMQELLGVTPRRDSEGVLQDIHWAMGLFGYFPTYSLGNLYSAQLFDKAKKAIPDLGDQIGKGNLTPLRNWLIKNVHRPGRTFSAAELVRRASGQKPSPRAFVAYVNRKYGELYDL
jgi:carboxypeptidase Taq